VNGTGPRRADADAKPTSGLAKPDAMKAAASYADILDPILTLAQRFDDGVDAVSHDAKAVGRAPRDLSRDPERIAATARA
jgi:hypothetical protein